MVPSVRARRATATCHGATTSTCAVPLSAPRSSTPRTTRFSWRGDDACEEVVGLSAAPSTARGPLATSLIHTTHNKRRHTKAACWQSTPAPTPHNSLSKNRVRHAGRTFLVESQQSPRHVFLPPSSRLCGLWLCRRTLFSAAEERRRRRKMEACCCVRESGEDKVGPRGSPSLKAELRGLFRAECRPRPNWGKSRRRCRQLCRDFKCKLIVAVRVPAR